MRGFFTRSGAIARKELIHFLRDPRAIYLALGMPILLTILFGYAVTFDLEEARLAVVDHDRTPASRRLIHDLGASDAFHVAVQVSSATAADRMFRRGEARAVVVVPRGFARHLARSEPAPLQVLMDGTDGTIARTVLGYTAAFAREHTLQILRGAGLDPDPPLGARVRTWFNPGMRSALFVVPGVVALVLAIVAVLLTALSVAREWERGSMEQLFSTPVGRLPVVVGKLAPYVALGFLQMLLVTAAGAWVFDVPIRGSLLLLTLITGLFLVCVLAQGLLISVLTKNQQVATQAGAISSLLPSFLLSGFLFPIENMAPPLQLLTYAVPARYMVAALRGILLQGRGVEQLWPQLLGLGALSVLLVAGCTLSFRRRLD